MTGVYGTSMCLCDRYMCDKSVWVCNRCVCVTDVCLTVCVCMFV